MNDRDNFIKSLKNLGVTATSAQLEACDIYIENLAKWQKKINLVGASTLKAPYTRHILDAAQLAPLVPRGTLLDVGSGAGITLCEQIAKKTAFLNNMVRKMNLEFKCNVITQDVTTLDQTYDIITGRGVTNISNFLTLTSQQRHNHTLYILQKGASFQEEIEEAYKIWHFTSQTYNSIVNAESKILIISNIEKR